MDTYGEFADANKERLRSRTKMRKPRGKDIKSPGISTSDSAILTMEDILHQLRLVVSPHNLPGFINARQSMISSRKVST